MEEEPEVLDWGNEEDEVQTFSDVHRHHKADGIDSRRGGDIEDAEDAVSLGGDDEDDLQGYVYQSRSQDDSSVSSFHPAKSHPLASHTRQPSREHQQAPSTGSQKRSPSREPPQHSPQRSQSFSKITHALPPKPAVANVPYLHPSHPSIIEATAMASGRTDRDKKSNGIVSKSGEGANILPPDWEIRYPRSGGRSPYYYNVRTHKCTWTPPTSKPPSIQDKDPGGTQAPESRSAGKSNFDSGATPSSDPAATRRNQSEAELSYEDRHYRPDVRDSHRPRPDEERFQLRDPPRPHSVPLSPPTPKEERAQSLKHHREQDHQRSRRASSPRAHDLQRDESQATSHDDWGLPHPHPLETSSRVRSASPPARRHSDVNMTSPAIPAFEEPRNDTVWSAPQRHRSPPPPHLRTSPSSYTSQAQATAPGTVLPLPAPRQKSRFDRPADTSQQSALSRGREVSLPTESSRQRDQTSELISVQTNADNTTKGMRQDDFASDNISNRASSSHVDHKGSAPSFTGRSTSASPISDEMQLEQPRIRKRQPLPSQSMRFRESERSRGHNINQLPSTSIPASAPSGPRDGNSNAPQRSTNMHSSAPSGPRFQPQHSVVRDVGHLEPPRALRIPPSGPSASVSRPRSRHSVDAPNESSALRGRDSIDVDNVTPSRASFRLSESSIRAGSGMYADREQNADLPKGPRAMATSKLSAPMPPPTGTLHSISPTIHSADRKFSGQEYAVNRLRERSPPPHLVNHERWESYGEPPERHHTGNPISREDVPTWRTEGLRNEDPSARQKMAHDVERSQVRREPPTNQNRRAPEFSRAPPPSNSHRLSGGNNVPIGIRKSHPAVANPQQETSPHGFAGPLHGSASGRNTEPSGNRVPRNYAQSSEPFESSPPFSKRVVSPVNTYQPASTEGISSAPHRRSAGGNPPLVFERGPASSENFQPNATTGRSRRDSYYPQVDVHRFEQSTAQEQTRSSTPRTWIPRQPSPPPAVPVSGDDSYRPVTPPPLSREPPAISPTWDSSFGSVDRSGRRYHESARQQNRGDDSTLRRGEMDHDSHFRRQPAAPPSRERLEADPGRSSGGAGLESRLGERYDDRYAEVPHRHGHPSNPPFNLNRDDPYVNDAPRQARSGDHDRSHPFNPERPNAEWSESVRQREESMVTDHKQVFENLGPPPSPQDARSKSARTRRFGPALQSKHEIVHSEPPVEIISPVRVIERRRDDQDPEHSLTGQERPSISRWGGSLLDRLSLDNAGGIVRSASLRDRVQIPSKRDRDEMMMSGGDAGSRDASFEFDDGTGIDPVRKNRRRSGRPRRGKGRNGGS